MGDLLRTFWQPVAVAAELLPGKATAIRIMGEDLTLYRGETGKAYIVAARCAHRLSLLHTGWIEGDCIRCFYHGWKYDGTGQCVESPAEKPEFAKKIKIASYPAQEYGGLIFAYMANGRPPEFPRKAELDRSFGVKYAYSFIWPCNWFQRLENSIDATHVSFVHRRSTLGATVRSDIPDLSYEETEWGIRQTASRGPGNIRVSEILFPNCNHIVSPDGPRPNENPWTDIFNFFVPVDDEHTAQFSARCAPLTGDAAIEFEEWLVSNRRYNPADQGEELFRKAPDFEFHDSIRLVAAQDYVAQVGQGPIVERSKERLGKSDAGIILLRKIFKREMEAAKNGLAGKKWRPRRGLARLPLPPGIPKAEETRL
jgi:5,5'-dehydrodivanillate O-demethylase